MNSHNFIVVRFGDNDFGHQIRDALVEGVEHYELNTKACPVMWKRFIIAYLIGNQLKRNAIDSNCSWRKNLNEEEVFYAAIREDYFDEIKVTFEQNQPTFDDDHGSAVYDLNLKYAWTI